jgi:hypothetical protein
MKLVSLAAVLVLVAGTLALGFYSENRGTVQTSTLDGANNALSPAPFPMTNLGNVATLDQARQFIGVNFSYPTFTPAATTLSQIRVREGVVALIYENPTLPNLSTYSSGKIILLILKDNSSYTDPTTYRSVQTETTVIAGNGSTTTVTSAITPLSPSYQLVTVSGHPGWAFSPTTLSNGLHEDGRIEWWAGSVHYVILAELPANILVQIAESMNS